MGVLVEVYSFPEEMTKAWSESAREASLEARRGSASRTSGGEGEYFQNPKGTGTTPSQERETIYAKEVDMAPGFKANLAIQEQEDKQKEQEEKLAMVSRIAAHPPTWLPKEKHKDWKETVQRNKTSSYKAAAVVYKAHDKKVQMAAASQRAQRIQDTSRDFASRWKNKQ